MKISIFSPKSMIGYDARPLSSNRLKTPVFLTRLALALALLLAGSGTAGRAAPAEPPETVRAYLPVLPYAPAPPVEFVNLRFGRDRGGKCRFRGEIGTTSDRPVYEVQIEARVYDELDQLVGVWTGTPVLTATLPGQLNPFEIGTMANCLDPDSDKRGEAAITGWELVSPVAYTPLSAEIFPKESPPENLVDRVTVRIENDGPVPLEDVEVLIWSLYQYEGIIHPQTLAEVMLPGEAITITESFIYPVFLNTVHAAAQGVVPQQP